MFTKYKKDIIIGVLILIAGLFAINYVCNWYDSKFKPSLSVYNAVKEIPKAQDVPKKILTPAPKHITAYDKEAIKKVLKLDDRTIAPNEEVTATGQIKAHDTKYNALSVLDTQTGDSKILIKEDKSFFGLPNDRSIYAKVGYSTNSETQVTVGGEYKILRVGNVKFGLYAEGHANFSNAETGNRQNVEAVGGVVISY